MIIEAFGLPREHDKSTINSFNSFLFPLYSTLYNKSQFTLIISAKEQIALPFLDMIKDELENNQLLLEDFGVVKGNRWNNNEIWIKGRNKIDACIMIRGIDGSLRGIHFKQYRPQLVLLDDLLKDDTAKSETKREQVKSTFTDVVIPKYLDYYYLMCKKQSMGDKSFFKELQNDPRSTDDYIFQNIQFYEKLPTFDEMDIMMYIDPAIKAGKRNDYSAVTILGKHNVTGQMYVIDGSLFKLLPDDLFSEIIELLKVYPVEKIGFEATQAQSYMKHKFEESLWDKRIFTPVEEINSKGQKHERIITLEPDIKRGYILFNRNNIAYNNQVKDYNKGAKHDDAPDSLYGAVQLMQCVQRLKFFERGLLF